MFATESILYYNLGGIPKGVGPIIARARELVKLRRTDTLQDGMDGRISDLLAFLVS